MSQTVIVGKHGFLGSALAERFTEVTSWPTKDTKILFHFASPVHPQFDENPDYYMSETINSFLYLLPYCRDHGIYFVYPSSALVYEKDTAFAKCKKIMELMASCYPNTLGLRIFPVYGVGEQRTVISKWCRLMKQGQPPSSVYGDGTQERNFIYIDDVIDQILDLVNQRVTGIRDIASGEKGTSFNDIIKMINKELHTDFKPEYVPGPKNYPKGIFSKNPGRCKVSLKEGIHRICQEI